MVAAVGIIPARAGFTPIRGSPPWCQPDHPRSRGVYPSRRRRRRRRCWIIPARAGFTRCDDEFAVAGGDHPRSRGVYTRGTGCAPRTTGSSPLARGLPASDLRLRKSLRIIPARAGFTILLPPRLPALMDHPRSRGVYENPASKVVNSGGSSPLARGLRGVPGGVPAARGIIPARAGFTRRDRRRGAVPPDHPRSRGVYARERNRTAPAPGSSPLARGLRRGRLPGHYRPGIIPARAGFTHVAGVEGVGLGDHPRSRGVYVVALAALLIASGSSPLARGLPGGCQQGDAPPGIIPARAGFTFPRTSLFLGPMDHPRSRGVYPGTGPRPRSGSGSSPLARGLLSVKTYGAQHKGIIPARAGFTP